jgi:hypothetical protein
MRRATSYSLTKVRETVSFRAYIIFTGETVVDYAPITSTFAPSAAVETEG